MANQKSTTLIALGVAVFVVGGALLFLVVRHNDKKSPKAASTATVATTTTLAPGTKVFGATATTPTTIIQFKIPSGDNAVAVQMNYFPGGGGYVQAGDNVNVFAVVKATAAPGSTATPGAGCSSDPKTSNAVVLIQSNLKVLSVIGQPPAQLGQPTSFLLAAPPQVAAQLIYAQTYDSLYFSLTSAGQAPAAPLAITCANAL